MDIVGNQIEFNVALNALQDEVLSRLQQINILQIEFLRQFQCHHTSPDTHPSLVYSIRKILATVQDVYEGVKSYFADLNMEVTYELFRKIQLFMVNGYNFLARALLSHIDSSEQRKTLGEKTKNREALLIKHKQQKLKANQNSQSRKLQHCDYTIGFFQSQEAKITEQMHKVRESLLLSRQLVEKLVPSKAVKELTEIKQQAQVTLQNTEKIFEQTYQLKYLQFKNYLSHMLKPQDIANEFCENVKVALHDRFTNGVKKSAIALHQMIKNEENLLLKDMQMQTDDVQIFKCEKKQNFSKNTDKMQNLLLKERRINEKLSANLQLTKKQLENSKHDKQRLTKELNQTKTKLTQTQQNYQVLTKLYEERRQLLMQLQSSLGVQAKMIQDLKVFEWRYKHKQSREVQVNIQNPKADREVQVKLEDEQQLIAAMRKRMEKLRSRILELELKKEKEDKVSVPRQSKRSSKLSDSLQLSEGSFTKRSSMRKRTQTKKRTLMSPALSPKNESSENLNYAKKLSNAGGRMKQQMQMVIQEQSKKRYTVQKVSNFMLDAARISLKSISEVQITQQPNSQYKQSRNIATQTIQYVKNSKQSLSVTDKSIQACQDEENQSEQKIVIQRGKKLTEYPKALPLMTRQKSDFKIPENHTKSTVLKSKQNKQVKSLGLAHRKQKTYFKSVEDNFLGMERQMLRNTTVHNKQRFQNLNIQNQERNGLSKRNIQKTSRYLFNHKPKPIGTKNLRNMTFQEKCSITVNQASKIYQKRECLINVDKITLQRSFDLEHHRTTYFNYNMLSQPIVQ